MLRISFSLDARRRAARAAAAALLASVAACGSDATSPATSTSPTTTTTTALTPTSLTTTSGNAQTGVAGAALAQSLVVQVTSSSGTPVSGATVTFAVTAGSATLSAPSATTDANGQARVDVTLGTSTGAVTVRAAVSGTALTTSFALTALAATATTTSCTASALAVGEAATQSAASICLGGGTAGAEYAVIPFNTSTTATSRASVTATATGITPVTTLLTSVGATGGTGTLGLSASVSPRGAFERQLRASERAELAPRLASARSWYARRGSGSGARLAVIPGNVGVGSLVTLNAQADYACSRPTMRAGRVMAVGSKALVVADTLNPSGGYTQAEYASIAATFDTLVDAVDTKNFGQPTDIDGNGHVVLFFTSAVNALTPKNAGYFIGGFFYSRDLFPTTATSSLDACAGSNQAEMFYLMVPDPSGTINGNVFSKTFVTSSAIAVTAHEYEHLINSSRRLYVNTAAEDFEETWLDEGLAHVAEELVFYARAGLAPLGNIDATKLRSSTAYRTAFNDEGIDNFSRLETYLENPAANSPYADNDSLATRGATWAFLRWAVDHQATAQSTLWSQLVNSNTTGLANLRQVFGSDLTTQLRDWATSLLLDDVTGATTRFQAPSWNLRSIFDALSSTTTSSYPLATQSLSTTTPTTVSIAGGSAAYLRFGVGAGATGSVSWTAPSNVSVTVVRLR